MFSPKPLLIALDRARFRAALPPAPPPVKAAELRAQRRHSPLAPADHWTIEQQAAAYQQVAAHLARRTGRRGYR